MVWWTLLLYGVLLPGVQAEHALQPALPGGWSFKEIDHAAQDMMEEMNRHLLHGVQEGDADEDQAEDELHDQGEQPVQDDDDDTTLEALEGHRDTYLLYVFRADPAERGRPTYTPLHLQPGWQLQEVKRILFHTWPDLQGQMQWKLLEVNGAVGDSTTLYPPGPVFMIWAEADLLNGEPSSIVLTESQVWDLELGTLQSSMWPLVLPSPTDVFEIYEELGMRQACRAAICPIAENDMIKTWKSQFALWDGSFVTLGYSGDSPHFRGIIGPPTRITTPTFRELPPEFQDAAEEVAQQECPDRVHSRARMAVRHQLCLTHLARDVYWKTDMTILTNPHLRVFKLSTPTTFSRFTHAAQRDPFGLLLDLLDAQLVPADNEWLFVELHQAVYDSFLPRDFQHVGIIEQNERAHDPSLKMSLLELVYEEDEAPPRLEYQSRLLQRVVWAEHLYQEAGLTNQCQLSRCEMKINNQNAAGTRPFYIDDGAFIQVRISRPSQPEGQPMIVDVYCEDASMEQAEVQHVQKKSRTTLVPDHGADSHSTDPPTTLLGFGFVVFLWELHRLRVSPVYFGAFARSMLCLILFQLWWVPVEGMVDSDDLRRIGEALHPGPIQGTTSNLIWIGTANPSGLRGKEAQLMELPTGIWGLNETHLSAVNMQSVVSQVKRAGLQQQRNLFVSPGAPAPLRARSQSEGAWTGVCVVTDLIPREIQLHWPQSEYSQGRVQVHEYWFGPCRIVGANVYLWPTSPTWPKAAQASEELLQTLTQEVVYSRRGPRFILGDFNRGSDKLPSTEHWHQQGWREIQDLAEHFFGKPQQLTYRESTAPDQVWISPELIQYFKTTECWSLFADHKVLGGSFDIPVAPVQEKVWTLPTAIPWDRVQKKEWQKQEHKAQQALTDKDDLHLCYQQFWQRYENSFDGYIDAPGQCLPCNMRGRAQRVHPEVRAASSPLLKPSRPGEIRMASDFLGRATSRWFKQARRIQSLKHSILADKQTLDAQLYRAELWRAIRTAKGFKHSFVRWWTTRPIQLHGVPLQLTEQLPTSQQITLIFDDFQHNYRRLEAWHAKRRSEILRCQYESDRYKIYESVKPPSKGSLTHLEEEQEALIIGISDDHTQVQLDDDLSALGTVDYLLEGARVAAQQDEDMILTFDEPQEGLEVGQEVLAFKHYSTPIEIDTALRDFWKKRWSKPPPTDGEWCRILDFAAAYLPHCDTLSSPLTVAAWQEVNKRYTAKSARGPDGVAPYDLLYLPDEATADLLQLLEEAENRGEWPEAMKTGFVYSLPKRETARSVSDYRPVIIYSAVYRSWSSLRARAMLRRISQLAGTRQFGFMPGQETAEVWVVTQALIELAILQGQPLTGFVCDIQKAFENIPREPIKKLADQLGFDKRVTSLWFSFLSTMRRRFMVAGQVGDELLSSSGFPEGCGLSCVAMGIANLSYHAYMRHYTVNVTELSYVDNLAHLTEGVADLQHGIIATETWAKMWGFQLDTAKSYVWAIDSELRRTVAALGWKVCTKEKDLGAPMAYGKVSSSTILLQRIQTLNPLLKRLQRLPAPEWQKQLVIRTALWQRAFYGCSNSGLAWNHIKELRTAAMKTLGHSRAGASSGLRLHICCHEQCDPGFFQCWNVLQTIRRVMTKRPSFVTMWSTFMKAYTGNTSRGPFAKLLEIGGQLGWYFEPPWFVDSDGCRFHLSECSEKKLYLLARESWTQKIAYEVNHRKDMEGLTGLDDVLLRAMESGLGVHRAKINVVRDGTFIVDSKKAKFDYSKQGDCRFCGAADTMDHRCTGCPELRDIYAEHAELLRCWDTLPKSLKHHCLPSRNPSLPEFKRCIEQGGPDYVLHGGRAVSALPEVDLFIDGSGLWGKIPFYSLGAWAIVNSQLDRTEASGILHGLIQTCDKAELTAMMYALELSSEWSSTVTIWTDSAYVGQGTSRLLTDIMDLPDAADEHEALWNRVQMAIQHRQGHLHIQHIAAHRDITAVYQDCDDWSAYWNDRADRAANEAHGQRSSELRAIWERLVGHHQQQQVICGRLHRLHAQIAERFLQSNPQVEIEAENVPEENDAIEENMASRPTSDSSFWLEELPVGWLRSEHFLTLSNRFSMAFVRSFVQLLLNWSQEDDALGYAISWIELVFLMHQSELIFPHPHPGKFGTWRDLEQVPSGQQTSQTLAALVRVVRSFCQAFLKSLDLQSLRVTGISLMHVGVFTPQQGLPIRISRARLTSALRHLSTFTRTRPIRTVNDLARPLC